MNKKSLLSILLLSVLCVVNVYSDVGVGGEIGFEAGPYYNNFFSGTIRSDKTPWTLSVNSSFFDGFIFNKFFEIRLNFFFKFKIIIS